MFIILRLKNAYSKQLIDIEKEDISTILTSSKVFFGEEGLKYFTWYKGDDKIEPSV